MTVTATVDNMKSKLGAYYSTPTASVVEMMHRFQTDANFDTLSSTPGYGLWLAGNRRRAWYTTMLTALSITYGATDQLADLAHNFWLNANLTTLAAL